MHIKELQEACKHSINNSNVGLYFPVILGGKLTIGYHRQCGTTVIWHQRQHLKHWVSTDYRTYTYIWNFQVPWNAGNFLTSSKPVSFSKRTLHHGLSKYMYKCVRVRVCVCVCVCECECVCVCVCVCVIQYLTFHWFTCYLVSSDKHSRVNFLHQNKENVTQAFAQKWVVLEFNWKITFNNKHLNYVIFLPTTDIIHLQYMFPVL